MLSSAVFRMLSEYLNGEMPLVSRRDSLSQRNQRGSRPMSKHMNISSQEARIDLPSGIDRSVRALRGPS